MAGFIFSIGADDEEHNVKTCIQKGIYAAKVKDELTSSKSKQVVASVLCDYISMKPGDNVYFLAKRKIFGVGKLVAIGDTGSCVTKNYPSAHQLITFPTIPPEESPLDENDPSYRWMCYFQPEGQFFKMGVDMDDVLLYRPASFRMLRAFQDRSFIKIDDEENRALKEFLYLANQGQDDTYEFNPDIHNRIASLNLSPYAIQAADTIKIMHDEKSGEVTLEMLVEAAVLEELKKEDGVLGKWDYISHQVIASPFKPIRYIDKIDIFAYRFLSNYPDENKPIEKYLIIELKKEKATHETVLQAMRYVDWVCKEYASGDYSRIEAKVIALSYSRDADDNHKEDCTRHFISTTHPIKTGQWDDLKLYRYSLTEDNKVVLAER